jgi:hypothetical protein
VEENEYKRQLSKFVTQLAPYIKFLWERWQEFCQIVEKNAEQLIDYQKKHLGHYYKLIEKMKSCDIDLDNAKKTGDTKKEQRLKDVFKKLDIELAQLRSEMENRSNILKEQDFATWSIYNKPTNYLNLPKMFGDFYAPKDIVAPLSWINNGWNPRRPTHEESLLCDYAILCITYDKNIDKSEQ